MENKKYYYLKLKEDYFDSDEIKVLESMENGYLYSNILLKLYLKALKNDGKLMFNEFIPYDNKMLATITGHNVDVIEKAIKVFQAMHIIEILDNGAIYMLNIQKMIGSISSEGIRKAQYRERINIEKDINGTLMGQCPDIISISNSNSISNSISSSKKEKKEKKQILPSSLDEVIEYARERGREELAKDFYEFYSASNWVDYYGNKILNWKQKFITYENKHPSQNKPKFELTESEKALSRKLKEDERRAEEEVLEFTPQMEANFRKMGYSEEQIKALKEMK